ncbi:MAG: PIN domain-containing protein [Chloroflexi bacterium]|nr:PIN domain-containing protein [Chloroflexota bacterium]
MLYVADTHALYWYLTADKQLSRRVKSLFDALGLSGDTNHMFIPTLVLAEIVALEEKRRRNTGFEAAVELLEQHAGFSIVPLTVEIVDSSRRVTGAPELFDRLIAATALSLEATLVTRDAVLTDLHIVPTFW